MDMDDLYSMELSYFFSSKECGASCTCSHLRRDCDADDDDPAAGCQRERVREACRAGCSPGGRPGRGGEGGEDGRPVPGVRGPRGECSRLQLLLKFS